MKLLIQPGEGVSSIVAAIDKAKRSVEILIFRFDRREVEKALIKAAGRGVFVHALIANTNRGGEQNLRDLETRLLAGGVTVARTADDMVRYHGKMLIIDHRELMLLAYNFTYADTERSRSFGVVTTNKKLVADAAKLFEADTKRQEYQPDDDRFAVSPANSRKVLSAFIRGARKELWIYDPKISDASMCRLIEDRAKAGVDVRVLGRMTRRNGKVAIHHPPTRLHARTMIRDRTYGFVGSQSLRSLELDARREVGIIFRDATAVKTVRNVFEQDWAAAEKQSASNDQPPTAKVAKKIAKVVTKELPAVVPIVEVAVKELVGTQNGVELNAEELEKAVKEAVRQAVKTAVQDAVQDVVEEAKEAAPPKPAGETRVAGGNGGK